MMNEGCRKKENRSGVGLQALNRGFIASFGLEEHSPSFLKPLSPEASAAAYKWFWLISRTVLSQGKNAVNEVADDAPGNEESEAFQNETAEFVSGFRKN